MSKSKFKKVMATNQMGKTSSTLRIFSYEIGDLKLSFTLNVDSSDQPKKWLKLLEESTKDIKELVEAFDNG